MRKKMKEEKKIILPRQKNLLTRDRSRPSSIFIPQNTHNPNACFTRHWTRLWRHAMSSGKVTSDVLAASLMWQEKLHVWHHVC